MGSLFLEVFSTHRPSAALSGSCIKVNRQMHFSNSSTRSELMYSIAKKCLICVNTLVLGHICVETCGFLYYDDAGVLQDTQNKTVFYVPCSH